MISKIIIALIFIISPKNDFENNLRNYFDEIFSDYKNYSYEIVSQPNYDDSKFKLKIDNSKDYRLNSGYMYLPVVVKSGSKEISNGYVTLKVQLYSEVLVANQDINRSVPFEKSFFTRKIQNTASSRFKPVRNFKELENKRAKYKIAKGTVLNENKLEEIPLIKRGAILKALYKNGNVVISIKAKAKEDGYKNEKIRIKASNKRYYTARVENEETVRIIE